MKLIRITTTLFAAGLLFACNNSEEKKQEPTKDSIAVDTTKAKTVEVGSTADTIEIYHFKGREPYINTEYIKACKEQEKALLAYYCYFFNTSCKDTKHCLLTEALGLGEQNSKAHQALVLKWFTDDETKQLVKEGGRITPEGSKNMSWFEELKFTTKGGLLTVRYYSAWKTEKLEGKGRGTDEYQLDSNRIKVIGRLHEDI
jgi:hypothetical protein